MHRSEACAAYEILNQVREGIGGAIDLRVKVRKPCSTRAQPNPLLGLLVFDGSTERGAGLDGDGQSSEEGLLRRWPQRTMRVVEFVGHASCRFGVVCGPVAGTALTSRLLVRVFNAPLPASVAPLYSGVYGGEKRGRTSQPSRSGASRR